jgi:hypothetical protein
MPEERSTFSANTPPAETNSDAERPDCMAGLVGLELRNVGANYPFERSRRFAGIQPKYGHRDCSRLSCGIWICSSGLALPGSSASVLSHRDWPRFLPIQRCSAGGQTSNTIAHFALDQDGVSATTEAAFSTKPRQARTTEYGIAAVVREELGFKAIAPPGGFFFGAQMPRDRNVNARGAEKLPLAAV